MINNIRLRRRVLLASAAGLVCSLGGALEASAQTASVLQEVVVTAERRTSDVQKTATSVTVQPGEDLLQRGKFSLTTILETVPNVAGGDSNGVSGQPTGNDSPGSGITIRGIASNGGISGQTIAGVSSVAVYADNVYGGIGGDYDIDRVEVLRGPQGTLYGRSATAGLVAIHTANPNLTDFGGTVSLEGGSYGLFHATGAANLPLISDTLALRVAANHYERDGIDIERGDGASELNGAKAKLLYRPTDAFSLLVGGAVQYQTLYNGGVTGSLTAPNTFKYAPFSTGSSDLKTRQVWAEANWDVAGVRLTYLPAYRDWTQKAKVFVPGVGGGSLTQTVDTPHDEFITQELRVASGPESKIKWQAGLFYYHNEIKSDNLVVRTVSGALGFHTIVARETDDLGAFAEATYPITDALRVTAGLRYDETTVTSQQDFTNNLNFSCNTPTAAAFGCAVAPPDAPNAGLPERNAHAAITGNTGRREFTNTTYKLRAEYDLTPDNLLYATVSTAFLPGDVQIGSSARGPAVFPYESEQLTAYEVGSKNRFLDQRLQINLGLFHYDYAGYQASIQTNPLIPGSAILFSVPLRMSGGEAETLFQLTPNDRIGLNLSHIDTKFHNVPALFTSAVAQSGLWGFSPTTATLLYDHDFALPGGSNLSFHGEGIWRSAYYVNATNPGLVAQGGLAYHRQDAYLLANASLTWEPAGKQFSLTGYVRNIADERYKSQVNLQAIVPLANSGRQTDPRTYGVVLTAKF